MNLEREEVIGCLIPIFLKESMTPDELEAFRTVTLRIYTAWWLLDQRRYGDFSIYSSQTNSQTSLFEVKAGLQIQIITFENTPHDPFLLLKAPCSNSPYLLSSIVQIFEDISDI